MVVGVALGFVFLMVEGTTFRELRAVAEEEDSDDGTNSLADPLGGP